MYLWVSYIGNLQFIGDKFKEIECVSDPAPARSRSGMEPGGQTTNRLRVEFFENLKFGLFHRKIRAVEREG